MPATVTLPTFTIPDHIDSFNAPIGGANVQANDKDLRNEQPLGIAAVADSGRLYTITFADENLGSAGFQQLYNIKYSYVVGSMVKGISSVEMVAALAENDIMSYYGTGGLSLQKVESEIDALTKRVGLSRPFGMNLLCNTLKAEKEEETVELFLRKGITRIEASAFAGMTRSIVLYRVAGLQEMPDGSIRRNNLIQAKVSRPEVATQFLKPAPERLLKALVQSGKITERQARLAERVPMADCICVESDSGGHTDKGVAIALLPSIIRLKNDLVKECGYNHDIYIGAAGGIGTPEAAAAMFILGADFIQTGSINQCTIEAGTSDIVKDMLQNVDVQDTTMAPAGDMFEIGSQVQVLRKGVFFPSKANKLSDIYRQYPSLQHIDQETKAFLEEKVFKKPLPVIEKETREYLRVNAPKEVERMDNNPKIKMARMFQWYFGFSNRAALSGKMEDKIDFQIHCGPAMGACNRWLKDTSMKDWRHRSVVAIADLIMNECYEYLINKLEAFTSKVR